MTLERPYGLKYSLTLHGKDNERLAGFDNAHHVRHSARPGGKGQTAWDHEHRPKTIRPYDYHDAVTLLEDFWTEVDSVLKERGVSEMKNLKVGIASYEDMKARTLAIASGALKPKPADPKVWFPSAESLVKVLSDKNRALLGTIRDAQPESLADLAALTGRQKSNLSRTLKTMERYGIVKLERRGSRRLVASLPYEGISVQLPLVH